MSLLLKRDPGPCPVDDAPHTTCTSADHEPTKGRQVVKQQRPPRGSARTPKSAPRLGSEPSPTVVRHYQRLCTRSVGGERVGREPDAQDRKGKDERVLA
jgi:hypothetical protein